MTAHRLQLFTDFVCPFCFIAEDSTVPRLLGEFELELDWCGFELHPSTPLGGRPLSDLFPGVDLTALHAQTQRFAAQFGVTGMASPMRLQNSRRALAMAEYARERGKLAAFRQAAFDAHWRGGMDLEDDDALRAAAREAELDPTAALAVADEPATLARVDERQAAARRAGISGIPTFILGTQRIVGCQPYSELEAAAIRAGVPRRHEEDS